jgi:hypothetical protein
MKNAIAYQRGETIIFHASSKTTAGVLILTEPVLSCALSNSLGLTQCVVKTLAGSSDGIPHPKVWKGLFDPVLRFAGVKSWGTFVKSTKAVRIEQSGDVVSFIPTENLGSKEGFMPMKQRTLVVQASSDLGETLLQAFAIAK